MSTHYHIERYDVNEYRIVSVDDLGWVHYYRVYETVVRRYVTRIQSRLLSPDGTVEVSRIEIPTNYLETEYVRNRTTQYVGVTRIAGSPAGLGTGQVRPPANPITIAVPE